MALLWHVRLHVLLEMITTAELLAASAARIGSETRMDALVPCQLLVACEGLAASFHVAFEGSLACKSKENIEKLVKPLESQLGSSLTYRYECVCVP